MSRFGQLAIVAMLAGCSADLGAAPREQLYLVQYVLPPTAADRAIIGYIGATIQLSVPLCNSLIIRSTKELVQIDSIPGRSYAVAIDSLNQVLRVQINFKNAIASWETSAVNAWSAGTQAARQYGQTVLETTYRLSGINKLGELADVNGVDLEYTFPGQATTLRR